MLSGGDSVMNTRSEGTVTQVAPFLECMQCGLLSVMLLVSRPDLASYTCTACLYHVLLCNGVQRGREVTSCL